jgi:AraC family transcriptional regulator, dual regulator of chb operon
MIRLRLSEFIRRDEAYHFARVELPITAAKNIHRHDFHEIFWIERGQGIHMINGRRRNLRAGLCVCVHANDAHSVRARPGHTLRLVNVAFPSRTWQELRRRYFRLEPDYFAGPLMRREMDLTRLLSTELALAAEDLGNGHRSQVKIDRFLLNLFYRVTVQSVVPKATNVPDWLEYACQQIRENKIFAGGVPAFARLAGRSTEHVARQVRLHLHKTPTDIVNEARLAYAASQLRNDRRAIIEIALDCGLENLSHFYNLFKLHFGCTPRRYRLRHQRIVR